MLGVHREQYEAQVRAQAKRNADDIAQFDTSFRKNMFEYTNLFADLAQRLRSVQRCDTCVDPWQTKKDLVDNLRKLNNRFGYVLDRQLAIGNKNPDLLSVSQNHIAQKNDFNNYLDLLRDNPQSSDDDKKRFDVELAKLDQTIRVNVAIAPIVTPQHHDLVRESYASEDAEHDDNDVYTAEFNIYLEAETKMVESQLQLINAEIKLKLVTGADVANETIKRDVLKNTYSERLLHWQQIRDRAQVAEQQFGFVIIPRNVLEPHTDYMTDPPSTGNEHIDVQDEKDANEIVTSILSRSHDVLVQTASIQAALDQLAELDDKRHREKLGEFDNATLESRVLRERVRTLRVELLTYLRKVQFVFLGLVAFWNGSSSSGLQKHRFAVSDTDYLTFSVDFVQLLEIERQSFNTMIMTMKNDVEETNAVFTLAQRRMQNVLFSQDDTELEKTIKTVRVHNSQIIHPDQTKWLVLQDKVDNYEAKIGVDLRPLLYVNNRINILKNVPVLKDDTEYKTQLEHFLKNATLIEDAIDAMKPKLQKLSELQQQLAAITSGALDFKQHDEQLLQILQDRKQLIDMTNQSRRDAQALFDYSQDEQKRKVINYSDNVDGHLITQYLIKSNEEMKANLNYYNKVATWVLMRKPIPSHATDPDTLHTVKNNIRDMMKQSLEARSDRDKLTNETQLAQDTYLDQAALHGYNYHTPKFSEMDLFSLSDDEKTIKTFQTSVQTMIQKLNDEGQALGAIVDIEKQKGTMDSTQFEAELRTAKQNFARERAQRSHTEPDFDEEVDKVISADVCKSRLLLGTPEYNMCTTLHCTSDQTSEVCKMFFDIGKKTLQEECIDRLKCEQALDVCEYKDDCFQQMDALRKPEARVERYCAQFAPFPNMRQKCEDSKCVSDSDKVCAQLKANVQNAQKRIDSQVAAILNNLPLLSLPQQELQSIAQAATKQRDAELHVILASMNVDLKSGKPKTLQDVGLYVNARHKTLEAMRRHTSPILDQARNVWKRWVHDVVEVLQQRCKHESWNCLAKAGCVNDSCATLVK